MSENRYAFEGYDSGLMARALGRDLDISSKQAIEICSFLRKKPLSRAKQILQNVIEKKEAIPFKRFTDGVGHRRGRLASGRYPMKASRALLKLLESVEANAQTKGLNTSELVIFHICAHKAHRPVHYGRHRGRLFKRSHVEVVVKEGRPQAREGKKPSREKSGSKNSSSKTSGSKGPASDSDKKSESQKTKSKKPEPKLEAKASEKKSSGKSTSEKSKDDKSEDDKSEDDKSEEDNAGKLSAERASGQEAPKQEASQ